ncbi:MAG: hypothetical protein RLZZ428_39 [Pseudomonadota bacterium]|jgi:murein L,D-transpeptidase YafK
MRYFFGLIAILLLAGCGSTVEVKDDQYITEACQQELLNAQDFTESKSIDKIVVVKKERKMYLYKNNEIQNIFPVSLGRNPEGHKEKQGDGKTPEGEFWISRKLCSEKYYRSLCISYPRPEDKANALRKGIRPGGNVTIHAQPAWNADGRGDTYTLSKNWTEGCVAVTNSVMKDLWYAVRTGVPIVIR